MAAKFGTFFILVGSGLVVLFILSDLAGTAKIMYLLGGTFCIVPGVLLRWTAPKKAPAQPSGRFSILKKKPPKPKGAPPAKPADKAGLSGKPKWSLFGKKPKKNAAPAQGGAPKPGGGPPPQQKPGGPPPAPAKPGGAPPQQKK